MEAYYDKDKGRWIFPGQENDAVADAAAGPPPTMVSVIRMIEEGKIQGAMLVNRLLMLSVIDWNGCRWVVVLQA